MRRNHKDSRKTLGPLAASLVTTLHEHNKVLFDIGEVKAITRLSDASARSFVRSLVDRGVVSRLKPGLFILVPFELGKETEYMGHPWLVAKALAGGNNYYLSHGTAMEAHQMITQPQLVVYMSTPNPKRTRAVMGTEFRFVRCAKKQLFGIEEYWATKQAKVRVSDIDRTIIDGLKQPEYCGGMTEVAKGLWIQREKVSPARLVEYALRLNIGAVIRRLGYLLDLYELGTVRTVKALTDQLTNTYVPLDPVLPSQGKHLHRWRLRLNVEPEELLSVVRT
ncbi:MAG TPA: type IV toxin-antitoxin system AbiEi family antitoxin [Candidatus Saccharimonadales bacterium]|nr:type IV toxin-antitoxin system AbiEi family antitoxin [Candidatus Saccharimonadales bacterium]